mmetsp:Transcript_14154/g.26767  ORF Transcript_14154/g.26767 Transcript_14154/m.26767 type:complete len:205 (-) Transcript_14154:172-786(-)
MPVVVFRPIDVPLPCCRIWAGDRAPNLGKPREPILVRCSRTPSTFSDGPGPRTITFSNGPEPDKLIPHAAPIYLRQRLHKRESRMKCDEPRALQENTTTRGTQQSKMITPHDAHNNQIAITLILNSLRVLWGRNCTHPRKRSQRTKASVPQALPTALQVARVALLSYGLPAGTGGGHRRAGRAPFSLTCSAIAPSMPPLDLAEE